MHMEGERERRGRLQRGGGGMAYLSVLKGATCSGFYIRVLGSIAPLVLCVTTSTAASSMEA
jgi:hypothetical protein